MVFRLLSNLVYYTILIHSTFSFAQQVTFSPEFEFTNAAIANANYGKSGHLHVGTKNLAAQEKWAELMEKLCKQRRDCKVIELSGSKASEYAYEYQGDVYQDQYHPDYRVQYQDGFYYDITLDPAVVEIKVKPSTVDEFKRQADRIQTDIFDFAKNELGLKPPKELGGHIHIGFESGFNGNLKHFRNFFVDLMNHQELWTLMKYKDFANAPPLAALPKSNILALELIIEDLDAGKINTIEDFAKRVRKEVY